MISTQGLLVAMCAAIKRLGYPCIYKRANQHTTNPYVILTVVNDDALITPPPSGSPPEACGNIIDIDIAVYGLNTNSSILMAIREACITAVNSLPGSLGCQSRPPGAVDDADGRVWCVEYATMRYVRR